MQDPFTGLPTRIRGRHLPGPRERLGLQDDHRRRLEALARLGAAAAECGLRADSDRDLVLLAEDEVSLLEAAGPEWAALGAAIRDLRGGLPLRSLADFGFSEAEGNPLEEPNPLLRQIGVGVEAWAFASVADGSVRATWRGGPGIGRYRWNGPKFRPNACAACDVGKSVTKASAKTPIRAPIVGMARALRKPALTSS